MTYRVTLSNLQSLSYCLLSGISRTAKHQLKRFQRIQRSASANITIAELLVEIIALRVTSSLRFYSLLSNKLFRQLYRCI